MAMDKVLSVSIAAYNVQAYLAKTLDSFICDPKTMQLFEVLIVNDGSRDSTPDIAKEYAANYPDTFVFIDKQNGGYGSTINASLKCAKGKYFKLVDGDDWVDTQQFVKFVERLEDIDADMVLTKYIRYNDENGKTEISGDDFVCDGITKPIHDVSLSKNLAMHQIAYRTSLLREIDLRITENCFYTDFEYNMKPLPYVRTICGLDLTVYIYRIGREGQSIQMSSWFRNIDQGITVSTNLAAYYEKTKDAVKTEKMRDYLRFCIADSTKNKYLILLMMPKDLEPYPKLVRYDILLKRASREIYEHTLQVASPRWRWIIATLRFTRFFLYRPISYMVHKRSEAANTR